MTVKRVHSRRHFGIHLHFSGLAPEERMFFLIKWIGLSNVIITYCKCFEHELCFNMYIRWDYVPNSNKKRNTKCILVDCSLSPIFPENSLRFW